jgi:predicted CopG family antitoxin
MGEKEQPIHARLDLTPGDPAYDKFLELKRETGLRSHSEFLRNLVMRTRVKKKESSRDGS